MKTVFVDRAALLYMTKNKVSIDFIVDELDELGAFDKMELAKRVRTLKKVEARKMLKKVVDDDGFPLIHSIVEIGADGRAVTQYKQEMLFTIGEYKQVIEKCNQREGYWRELKTHLAKNARRKFPEQATLFG